MRSAAHKMERDHLVDTAIFISSKCAIGGSVSAIFGWLSDINWFGVIGSIVAVLSLASQIYFNHKRDRREQRAHDKLMGKKQ